MHWIVDVTFGDDQSRVRKENAPQNMAVIKKSALNYLIYYKLLRKSSQESTEYALLLLACVRLLLGMING